MASLRPESDKLWSFLWGKRRSRRHAVSLEAQIERRKHRFRTEALDLSAGGVLLRVPVTELAEPGSPSRGPLQVIQDVFAEGFDLRFPESGLATRACLVRVSWKPGDAEAYYLGCQFESPLGSDKLVQLGLPPLECGPESGTNALPAELMPLQAARRTPMTLEIVDPSDVTGKPLYAGPLQGINDRAIATDLSTADPTEVAAKLGGRAFRLRVRLERSSALWAERAYLLAVRVPHPPRDGVSVIALATSDPPPSVRRRMARTPASSTGSRAAPVAASTGERLRRRT